MATWITHLRLAEALLNLGLRAETDSFLVGSIAPDSGAPKPDMSGYEPPKRVTHWHDSAKSVDYEAYFRRYLAPVGLTDAARAFHIGYYLHLLADDVWTQTVWRPKKQTPLYVKALADKDGLVHEIKKDWYGLDFLYLQAHPESIFYTRFRYLATVPDYLDYLLPGMLTDAVQKIQAYYRVPTFELQRPYSYLSQAEIDAYVEMMVSKATDVCREKGWLA
jgi:hypothetical protein